MNTRCKRLIRCFLLSSLVASVAMFGYYRHEVHRVATQPDRIENTDKSPEFLAAVNSAMEATVKIKVYHEGTYCVGTGTVIDKFNDKYLVLTCGHLFDGGFHKGAVIAEVFCNEDKFAVKGDLIGFDPSHDVGLVMLASKANIPVVKIAPKDYRPKVGEKVFSIGCNAGEDPTIRHTVVTGIDKYGKNLGHSNVEIFGAPVQGRSGGGLFDKKGVLVGVCLWTNKWLNIGCYAGPGSYARILEAAGAGRLVGVEPEEKEAKPKQEAKEETSSKASALSGVIEIETADWCGPCKKFKRECKAELIKMGWKIIEKKPNGRVPRFTVWKDGKAKTWTGYSSKKRFMAKLPKLN